MARFGNGEVFAGGRRIEPLREAVYVLPRAVKAPVFTPTPGYFTVSGRTARLSSGALRLFHRRERRRARTEIRTVQSSRRNLVAILCAAGTSPAKAKRIARREIPRSVLWRQA